MITDLYQIAKSLPDHPGVYFFKDKTGEILYIGKATSLRDRVSSYFSGSLEPSKAQMVTEAVKIEFELVDTVLEALMLEIKYIKKFKPKYNILSRDDKSMAYLAFTREAYPRVFIIRAREYERYRAKDKKMLKKYSIKKVYGPFFSADIINKVLKIISNIIYFRVCKNSPDKICLYGRMNLCPLHKDNPLTTDQYKMELKRLGNIFSGNTKQIYASLQKEMKEASKKQNFELAKIKRDQIYALQHINDISLIEEANSTEGLPQRMEAYDISHFGGKNAVGAFVVFERGKPEKSQYRRFIIRGKYTQDDTRMLKEVLIRRFNHRDWIFPNFILLDGGITQLNIAKKVLNKLKLDIVLVASAKGQNRKKTDLLWNDEKDIKKFNQKKLLQLIKSAQAEVHRFAITFQKKKRKI